VVGVADRSDERVARPTPPASCEVAKKTRSPGSAARVGKILVTVRYAEDAPAAAKKKNHAPEDGLREPREHLQGRTARPEMASRTAGSST